MTLRFSLSLAAMPSIGSASRIGAPMKFDPNTKELFTDEGELIKVLYCPLRMRWEQLDVRPGTPHRQCSECNHSVLDTATYSDAQVLLAVRSDPSTCLCVRASQSNVTLLPTRHAEPSDPAASP
jgi:hypothetical protein